MDRIRFLDNERHLTRAGKIGVGSGATLLAVGLMGVAVGVLLHRLIQLDSVLDTGGDWNDEGVSERWF